MVNDRADAMREPHRLSALMGCNKYIFQIRSESSMETAQTSKYEAQDDRDGSGNESYGVSHGFISEAFFVTARKQAKAAYQGMAEQRAELACGVLLADQFACSVGEKIILFSSSQLTDGTNV